MELIQSAVMQNAGIDTIERLAVLQREMMEYQAKLEWNDAMQRVQSRIKRIGADKANTQTSSKYASYQKLDAAIRPIYSAEGFSLSYNTGESALDRVLVLCDVARGGYTKTYRIDMPADGKGPRGNDVMTKTHATGSGVMYGRRYLLNMIFNLSVGEKDDDGNAASLTGREMPEKQYIPLMESIEGARTKTELFDAYKAAYKAAIECGDKHAEEAFMRAKDERKGEVL
jgi:hypothetical protein